MRWQARARGSKITLFVRSQKPPRKSRMREVRDMHNGATYICGATRRFTIYARSQILPNTKISRFLWKQSLACAALTFSPGCFGASSADRSSRLVPALRFAGRVRFNTCTGRRSGSAHKSKIHQRPAHARIPGNEAERGTVKQRVCCLLAYLSPPPNGRISTGGERPNQHKRNGATRVVTAWHTRLLICM